MGWSSVRVQLGLGLVLLGLACDGGAPADAPQPAREAPRVVSLSPLATRFVVAIGAAGQLVGVDAASARLEGAPEAPVVDLETAPALRPALVLAPRAPDAAAPAVVEFAPHDLEDVLALVREVGGRLVGAERAERFEVALSRPLARVGGASRGQPRPRVVAVLSQDPLVVAGGHSFETDLIEIAGGHSVTHPGEEPRLAIGADRWAELAPDLVWVVAEPPASERERRARRNALPPDAEVAFLAFERDFWLGADPAAPARRLRAVIEPIAARMAR